MEANCFSYKIQGDNTLALNYSENITYLKQNRIWREKKAKQKLNCMSRARCVC